MKQKKIFFSFFLFKYLHKIHQLRHESNYISRAKTLLESGRFYFSYQFALFILTFHWTRNDRNSSRYDVTNSFQNIFQSNAEARTKGLHLTQKVLFLKSRIESNNYFPMTFSSPSSPPLPQKKANPKFFFNREMVGPLINYQVFAFHFQSLSL